MEYAVIRVGNKQHRVRDGETLVVDRLRTDEGGTFEPDVLLGDDGVKVVATVVAHERGPKIRIGKYRRRTGYKRHNGFRAATTRIEISFGDPKRKKPAKAKAAEPEATPAGLPEGYADMKVGEIAKAAKEWDREQAEAALAYEQQHGARKGAIAALEGALATDEAPAEEPAGEPSATVDDEMSEEPEEPAATADEATAEEATAEQPTAEEATAAEEATSEQQAVEQPTAAEESPAEEPAAEQEQKEEEQDGA